MYSNPLQYSCLENPMDRGAWWAAVHRITNSWTCLKQLSAHTHTYICIYIIYTCIHIPVFSIHSPRSGI